MGRTTISICVCGEPFYAITNNSDFSEFGTLSLNHKGILLSWLSSKLINLDLSSKEYAHDLIEWAENTLKILKGTGDGGFDGCRFV